jgi:peptidyl-prolyl cis-trans isomerase C
MELQWGKWSGVVLTALALAAAASLLTAAEEQVPKDKVAVVNGTVITRLDLERRMADTQRRLSNAGQPLSDSQLAEIKKQALEDLIDRELLYQESQRQGIKVDKAAIDREIEALKSRFPSEAELKKSLARMGLSESAVRLRFLQERAIRELIEKEFGQKVSVADREVKAYYDKYPSFFKEPEKVRARHILIKVDPQADPAEKAGARKKLEKIQQKLRKGEDFADLARKFSQCPSAANGGDLGSFERGQMVKPFEEAAFALNPGDVSDIVETRFGYHLIEVIDRQPETIIPYEDVKDRLARYVKQEKIQKEVRVYAEKLKENANVRRFLTEAQ